LNQKQVRTPRTCFFSARRSAMALIEIDDPRDARLDVFRRVPDSDLRSWPGTPHGLFIGESDKVIGRALDAGVTCAALFMERKWVRKTQPIIDRLQAIDPAVPAYVVDHATFRAVTGYEVTRGALGALLRPAEPAVADVVRGAHRTPCWKTSPTTPTSGRPSAARRP
jgi:hypothetical protein